MGKELKINKMKTNVQHSILPIMAIILFNGCVAQGVNSITPSKNNITKDYFTEDFNSIETGIVGDVIYTQSDTKSVQIYGPDNVIPDIKVDVKRNTLSITMKNEIRISKKCDLKVIVSCPEITKVKATGVGDFKLEDSVRAEKLNITLEGVGDVVANNLDCKNIKVSSSGVGNIMLKGKTIEANYSVSGVGDIKAYELIANNVQAEASGIGNIQCNASQAINAELSGVGSIRFKGNPQKQYLNRSGVGKIKQEK